MNTAMSQEGLEEMLDRAVREVTRQTAGIQLFQSGGSLGEDICTVYVTFNKGFHTSLTLCADTALLVRMAHNIFGGSFNVQEDLEDFSKEYLNVLCGKIARFLKETTSVAVRFSVPRFYRGNYIPQDHRRQFILTYSDDENAGAQLGHHIPCGSE